MGRDGDRTCRILTHLLSSAHSNKTHQKSLTVGAESFREEIGGIIVCRTILDTNVTKLCSHLDEIESYIDVLSSRMVMIIMCEMNGGMIVDTEIDG
jgi:hypothetical protein